MICLHVSLLLSYELLSVCPIPYIEYGTFKKKKKNPVHNTCSKLLVEVWKKENI